VRFFQNVINSRQINQKLVLLAPQLDIELIDIYARYLSHRDEVAHQLTDSLNKKKPDMVMTALFSQAEEIVVADNEIEVYILASWFILDLRKLLLVIEDLKISTPELASVRNQVETSYKRYERFLELSEKELAEVRQPGVEVEYVAATSRP